MKIEELKLMIQEAAEIAAKAAVAPLEQVQRQYAESLANGGNQQVANDKKEVPIGIRAARAAKCLILGKNDPEFALKYVLRMYPDDKELEAAFKTMVAGTPSDGGFLIPENLSGELIPLLRAKAVVRSLGARSIPLPNGNLTLPKMTGGATATYIGEAQKIPKSKQTIGAIKLSAKKLASLVPLSNDLIRSASIQADTMVRDDLVQVMALKEDWAAFYGTGTQYTPAGVTKMAGITKRNDLGAIPSSSTLANILGVLFTKDIPWGSVGWAMHGSLWPVFYNLTDGNGAFIHRDEMNQGKIMGLPFKISNQLAYADGVGHKPTELILGDWSEFIIGEEMAMEFSASQEATFDDGTGTQVSAFQNDLTLLRVISKHDFGARHGEAFVYQPAVWTEA